MKKENNKDVYFHTDKNSNHNNNNNVEIFQSENVKNEKENQFGVPLDSFIDNNLSIKILKLVIENSATIQKGETIIITPKGLIGSKRKDKDKLNEVFFGYQTNLENLKVDYLLPPNPLFQSNTKIEGQQNLNNEGIYFKITYNPTNNNYTIKDLEVGNGTFIKITDDYYLVENSLVNIGDSYLVFTFIEDKDEPSEKNLLLKAYSGSIKYQPITFKHKIKKDYIIGRGEKDDVVLQDKMLSRVHCMIHYDDEKGWFIRDGNENGKGSTNGTWVFAFDEMEIIDGMLFKANSNLFSCHIQSGTEKFEF